ncbi:MAG: chemotaxis protein CheB [Thermoflexibacter sp.]|jgi:two-component system chemotaxis response regulator CheB|nr:chemotaxis protein CheB [Thermoflexibacter sp.]
MIKKVAVIGGSAGSIRVTKTILENLKIPEQSAVLICLHRLQSDNTTGLRDVLQYSTQIPIIEPNHREAIQGGNIYLAPANYHLVIEPDLCFNLSSSPLVQYSRPSIDVLFLSASEVFQENMVGVLLTGANKDGAFGMKSIRINGGMTIVQDPTDCFIDTMPKAAMSITAIDHILDTNNICNQLNDYFKDIM